jgi:hypothetical protein
MLGHVAKVLGDGFVPWLPRVVPLAVTSCEQEDGAFGDEGDDDEPRSSQGDADLDGDSDDSDDSHGHFNVRTGRFCARVDCCRTALLAWTAVCCATVHMRLMPPRLHVLACPAGVMDEKVAATGALGQYAEACPAGFMPYMEQVLPVLNSMCECEWGPGIGGVC